jgi:hypothetical protein
MEKNKRKTPLDRMNLNASRFSGVQDAGEIPSRARDLNVDLNVSRVVGV